MGCADPTCYRGTVSRDTYTFKDGPCDREDCKWPKELAPKPHFTDSAWKLHHDPVTKRYWFGG